MNYTLNHNHTKRNSLDTRAVFIEFLEYVNNGGGCLLRRQIFQNVFEELQDGDGIEGIVAFL